MQILDMYSEIVLQLEKLCETEASISRLEWFKLQHKEPGLKSYGVKTPAVRKLIKARAEIARTSWIRVFTRIRERKRL